jgi:O-acetyl-ADP-ribose deacetylase (regulator of RNase III)
VAGPFQLGRLTLHVAQGDIADQTTDAIVNAANSQLWMGAGVAGALKRRGGPVIEREAIAKGPIAPGEAVETTAGALGARYVIHAAVMGPDLVTTQRFIARATESALVLADRLGLGSAAMPALGTGVGGFPLEDCAREMLAVVRHVGRTSGTLHTVVFVLYGQDAYDAFATTVTTAMGTDA